MNKREGKYEIVLEVFEKKNTDMVEIIGKFEKIMMKVFMELEG